VWQPDVRRPLVALGPDPLSWSSGTLATKRFYLPFFRKTNQGKPYLVIGFTNALPFYFTISTLTFPMPVKPCSALKATDVAIGIRPALHRRDKGTSRRRWTNTASAAWEITLLLLSTISE
jgi:hypothetical protein